MGKKADYGRGHEAFLDYARRIVKHPNYKGMPDLYNDKGEIQWEAPSNRSGGKFKDTHIKRKRWWFSKAKKLGIDTTSSTWISETAKELHPYKRKPCKRCGRVMDIRYAYPSAILLKRIRSLKYFDDAFPLDPLEHITDLVGRLVEYFGERVFADLPRLLRTGSVTPPELKPSLKIWLTWIDKTYIPSEPSILSPGVMSNAPDRLDGFHSFNRCCREQADTGRSKENLQSYSTDRRVFEYWVEGDWVAADRLMGLVRTALKGEECSNGHPGPCAADHIGPISLGFIHGPRFRLLCKACNSAKNNRMSYSDVVFLREAEQAGEQVASWYCQTLWNYRKNDVVNDETALRLSKMLRDNRHTVMYLLDRIARAGHFAFLATFLGLEYADYDVTFENLHTHNHITDFDRMIHLPRKTRYAAEQKARRFRSGFAALSAYVAKENRNAFIVSTPQIEERIERALDELQQKPDAIAELDHDLGKLLATWDEEAARQILAQIPTGEAMPASFENAKRLLREAMDLVADELTRNWSDDRYVRITADDEDFAPMNDLASGGDSL